MSDDVSNNVGEKVDAEIAALVRELAEHRRALQADVARLGALARSLAAL